MCKSLLVSTLRRLSRRLHNTNHILHPPTNLTDELRPPEPAMPPRTTSADVLRWFSAADDRQLRCALPAVADFISSRCGERYLVTLTDQRKLSSQEFSQNIGRALHHTNKAFFGTHYKRHRTTFLATYAVQERTAAEGFRWHLGQQAQRY